MNKSHCITASPAKHEQLFELFRQKIEEGLYSVHERLPSELQMKETYGVSADTVRKGLSLLENSGLIYRVPYKGTFVAPRGKVDRILLVTNLDHSAVVDDFGAIYGVPAFQRGLYRQCYEGNLDYSLVLMNSDEYLANYNDLLLIHKNLAAVIFFRDPRGILESRDYLKKNEVPYLFYGSSRYSDRLQGDNVFFYDTRDLIATALQYLSQKGHRTILFAGRTVDERYITFCSLMQEQGIDGGNLLINTTQTAMDGDPSSLRKRGTAILACTDRQALVVLNALVRARVNVPADIAVLGMDNYPVGLTSIVPLSSVDIPITQDASECLRLMNELLQGKRNSIQGRSKISVMVRESA